MTKVNYYMEYISTASWPPAIMDTEVNQCLTNYVTYRNISKTEMSVGATGHVCHT